jgi:hypothetical protein
MLKDASQPRHTLAHLLEELVPLIDILKGRDPMLKGYLDSRAHTCGTPGCRCAAGEKHPVWILRIPQGGTTRNRSIPETLFRKLEPLTDEYRRFRQAAIRCRQLMRAADKAIGDIEAARQVDPENEIQRIRDGK